jgi:hypothetical protein
MAAKKPLIKTTAIQYCLDNPGGADDDEADVRSHGFQMHLWYAGAGSACCQALSCDSTDSDDVLSQAAADADEEAPVADAAEAIAEAVE